MPVSPSLAAIAVLLAAVAGGGLGVATHRWLARSESGAPVPVVWCAAGTGLVWAATVAAWAAGAVPSTAVALLLGIGWLAVTGSAVDVAVARLPDALTLPALPLVLGSLVPLGGGAVLRGAAGAVLLCAAHAGVRLVAPSAMGGGDVKLAAPVGAALGGVSWTALVLGTLLAAAFTAAAGTALHMIAATRTAFGGSPDAPAAGCRSGAAAAGPDAGAAGSCAGSRVRVGRSVPHGPSMLLGCVTVVAAAAAWPGASGIG